MNETETTDEELAAAAKRGDADAYDRLVRRYLRPAMALAWQFTASLPDAEDVVQESFHRAVRALGSYDEGRPFAPWFYTIVRNQARSAAGKAGRRATLAPTTSFDEDLRANRAADPDVARDLEAAIEGLAPMQQASFCLCDVEGYTSREAAAMLDVSEGTVRTHRHRAREHLRTAFGARRKAEG